jgi:ABC-type methionine transport system permease subunit
MRFDLALMLVAFVAVSAIAGGLGAPNLGTALAFGQMGFAATLVWVLLRR